MLTNYSTKELKRQILKCQNKECGEILSNHFVTHCQIDKEKKLEIKCWKCRTLK